MTQTKSINWDWYGTWLLDYFCAGDIEEAYDIWETAYLAANPDLAESRENLNATDDYDAPGTTLNLLENHYHESMMPIRRSPLFAWIYWIYMIRKLVRKLKHKLS